MKNTLFLLCVSAFAVVLCACGAVDMNPEADTPEDALNFELHRVHQRTLRYDCDGKLESDKNELIKDSREHVQFRPKSGASTGAEFVNLTTGDSPGHMSIGENGNRYRFAINITKTTLDMKVDQGINKIHYKYLGTAEPDEGDVYIKVSYKQSVEPRHREIRKSPAECESKDPKPKPTPKDKEEFSDQV